MPQKRTLTAEAKVIISTGGEAQLKNLQQSLETINSLTSQNNNIARYWRTQEQLINSARIAMERFKSSQDQSAARELINNVNALKASVNGFDMSAISKGIDDVYKHAQELTKGMHGIYDASTFSSFYSAINNLKTNLAGADDLIEKVFNGADASKAVEQIRYYKNAFSEAQEQVSKLQEKIKFFDETDISGAMAQIEDYKNQISQLETRMDELKVKFTQQGVDKFGSYLRSQNVISSDDMNLLSGGFDLTDWGDYGDVRAFIDGLVNEIRQGTKDADTAISQFKQTFHNLIEDSGGMNASDLQQITSAIEGMATSAREVGDASSGISTSKFSEFMELLQSGTSGGQLPDFTNIVESLERISNLNADNGIDAVRRLINAFQTDLSVSGNSLTKLGLGLEALTGDFDPGKLAALSSLKFDGLNELKVSKASLNNLATFLPTISSVNVDNLKRLSEINFENLNNVSVKKSAMEGLATLANPSDLTSVTSSLQQMASTVEALYNRISQSSEKAARDLVGNDARIASSISRSTGQIDKIQSEFDFLGLSDDRIDGVFASLSQLREAYKDGTLTYEEYDKAIRKVRLDLKDLGEIAKATAKAQNDAAKAAVKAAKQAEKEREKNAKLSENPEKLDDYMTKFNTLETNIRKQLSEWSSAKYGSTSESYRNLEQTADAVHEVTTNLREMTATGADEEFNRLDNSAKRLGNDIKVAGNNTKTFSDRIVGAIKNYAAFFTGMSAIMRIVQYGKQAVNAITEIDYSMNQLQIVTRETDQALSSYADSVVKIADKTAGSVTDLIDATTTYARLGYSLEESTTLADLTQMLQNVGDIDATSAQNAMTAIVKAFDLDVNDMEGILDRMVKVGNGFPISVAELSEGLNNASSILAVATNYQDDAIASFEKSAAMLTAANVTVQNVSKSSTALRTIIARLRKMDTELDELGEVMTSADYDKLTQALTKQNVALTDETGQLRDAYDVLKDMSEAWKTMEANERSALAQTFGSTRNQNVFISLMENFDEASEAMNAMQSSENALSEANAIYLESIKAHIQQFKTAFETMFYSESMVKFVNSIIDAGRHLLQIIEYIVDVVEHLGGLKTILPIVGALLSNLISTKIISLFTKFMSGVRNMGSVFASLRTQVMSYAAGQNAANTAMSAGAKAATALSSALGVIGMALGAASLVTSLVESVISLFKNDDSSAKVEIMSTSEIDDANSKIVDLYENYIELTNTASLTSEQQDELKRVTDDLADALGVEAEAIDSAKGSLGDYSRAVYDAVRAKQNLLVADAKENINTAEQELRNWIIDQRTELVKNNSITLPLIGSYITDPNNMLATFKVNQANTEEYKKQQAILNNIDGIMANNAGVVGFGYVNANDWNSILAYVEKLKAAKEALSETSVESELYKSISQEYSRFEGWYTQWQKSVDVTRDTIASMAYTDTMFFDGEFDLTQLSDMDRFRQRMIYNASAIVQSNDNVSMSAYEVIDAVDAMLRGDSRFAEFYSQAEEVAKVVDKTFTETLTTLAKYSKGGSSGGSVDLVFRPVFDTSLLQKAGWNVSDNDVSGLFVKTFANEEDTVAINFTPIILDEYGNVAGVLTPKELEIYANDVLSGVRDDDLNLQVGTKVELNEPGARASAENLAKEIQSVFDRFNLKFDGSKYAPLIQGLTAVDTASKRAAAALQELNDVIKEPDYDEGIEARASNFLKLKELYEQGDYGSAHYKGYARYFGFVDESGNPLSPEEMGKEMAAYEKYVGLYYDEEGKAVTDTDLALANWLQTIDEAEGKAVELGDGTAKVMGDLINFDTEVGKLRFDPSILFDPEKMQLVADEYGMTIENFTDMLNAYRMKSPDWLNFEQSDLQEWMTSAGLIEQFGDSMVVHSGRFEEILEALGWDLEDIQTVMSQVGDIADENNAITIDFNYDGTETTEQITSDVNGLIAQLQQAGYDADKQAAYIAEKLSGINPQIQADVVAALPDDLQTKVQEALDDQTAEVSITASDESISVEDSLKSTTDYVSQLDGNTFTFTLEAEGVTEAEEALEAISGYLGDDGTLAVTQNSPRSFLGEYAKYVNDDNASGPSYEVTITHNTNVEDIYKEADNLVSYLNSSIAGVRAGNIHFDDNTGEIKHHVDDVGQHAEESGFVIPGETGEVDTQSVEDAKEEIENGTPVEVPVKIKLFKSLFTNADYEDLNSVYDTLIGYFESPTDRSGIKLEVSGFNLDDDVLKNLTDLIENDMDPVGINILPETTEFVESLANGEIEMPENWTVDMTTALVAAYQEAIDSLPDTETIDSEVEFSDIDTTQQENAIDGFSGAVSRGEESVEQYSESLKLVSDQKVNSDNKTKGIDKVSGSANQAQKNVDNTSTSIRRLSGASVDVSNKAAPLNTLTNVAYNVVSVFERLLNVLRAWNNTPVQPKTLSVTGGYTRNAKGTRNAKEGLSLLGDEYSPSGQPKPELVISDGEAYIAGMHGPTFANLKAGDIVYPYSETKKILKNGLSGKIPAFYAGGTIDYQALLKKTTGLGGVTVNDNSTNTYNYNAGGGSGSSSSAEESKFEFVDWIEILIDRTERAINQVKTLAESAYKSITSRLKNTRDEIGMITEEITIQEKAYRRYMQQAESVGLSSWLKELVREGAIDINEYDEETRNLISDYQQWIEKAYDCADAITDLHETLASLYEDNFNNIQTDYENQLERFSFLTNEYNDFSRVISREQSQSINILRNELNDLNNAFTEAMLSGEIQEQSEAWYAMVNTIQDVRNQISEMYEQIFSDIEDKFDNQLQMLEHFTNSYNTAMDEMEARGRLASTKFYSALSDIEKQNVNLMTEELKQLEAALADAVNKGEIETYSSAWYEMRLEINAVKESIADSNLQLAEYAKSMRELDWSYFDYARDRVSQLNDEAEFLIDLMDKDSLYQDNGQFNERGMATMGLRVQNYDVDMAQADEYGKEIKRINKEIANDPYNTQLIERREELLNLQRESILAAESEKDAIKSLIEEGIKRELDNLKELIDTYNDSLDNAKDLYEWNKKISDQTKNIASLEKQLSAYENDTSEENRARVQKLRSDLEDARQNLEETQYDRYVSDSKKMLDELYSEYEELLNARLDNVDQLTMDMIDAVNSNAYDINTTLHDVSDDVGYTMTNGMQNIWSNYNDIASYYGDNFTNQLTNVNSTLNSIKTYIQDMIRASDKEASGSISGTKSGSDATDARTTGSGSGSGNVRSSTTTPDFGKAPLSLYRNLSYGSTGNDVKQLQYKLYELGYLNDAPDGVFGAYTLAAVNAFQLANGLAVDGVVGNITAGKLNGSPVAKKSAGKTNLSYGRDLTKGSQGEDVWALQARLTELGYYGDAIDGYFGDKTLQAVKDFQAANGLYVDGIVGRSTTTALQKVNSGLKLGKYMRYATGGLVTSTGLAQLDGTPQKPELVLNAEDTKNFIALKDVLSDLSSPLKLASQTSFITSLLNGGMRSDIGNVFNGGINISIDHVEDYNDFVNQLRQDRQFEKLIQSMTTDRIAGRNSLNKNNYRW